MNRVTIIMIVISLMMCGACSNLSMTPDDLKPYLKRCDYDKEMAMECVNGDYRAVDEKFKRREFLRGDPHSFSFRNSEECRDFFAYRYSQCYEQAKKFKASDENDRSEAARGLHLMNQ